MSKVCSKCGAEKDEEEFRLDKRRGTRRRECRACEAAARRQRWAARNMRQQAGDRMTHTDYMATYRQQPMPAWKQKVRTDTRQLILQGLLIHPGRCELCGAPATKERIEVHHNSYLTCDNVVFVCKECHQLWHKTNPQPPEPDPGWVAKWFATKTSYPEEDYYEHVDQ